MSAPTLINLPPPPSNPDTPSEMPGTPNSTTTSLSALSTTAIKDGHRGSALLNAGHHHQTPSATTLEAERADRISRLAGLERVTTARAPGGNTMPGAGGGMPAVGYFDAAGNPHYVTKKSTVGSASATGSVGGRTTWASGSRLDDDDDTEGDKMSIDTNLRDLDERDRLSALDQSEYGDVDGMSDEASLVAFGEGAGSTVSGPIYTRSSQHAATSPTLQKAGLVHQFPGETSSSTATAYGAGEQRRDARTADGFADGHPDGFADTTQQY